MLPESIVQNGKISLFFPSAKVATIAYGKIDLDPPNLSEYQVPREHRNSPKTPFGNMDKHRTPTATPPLVHRKETHGHGHALPTRIHSLRINLREKNLRPSHAYEFEPGNNLTAHTQTTIVVQHSFVMGTIRDKNDQTHYQQQERQR